MTGFSGGASDIEIFMCRGYWRSGLTERNGCWWREARWCSAFPIPTTRRFARTCRFSGTSISSDGRLVQRVILFVSYMVSSIVCVRNQIWWIVVWITRVRPVCRISVSGTSGHCFVHEVFDKTIDVASCHVRSPELYYIVADPIERIFTRPNFFDLESQRKKEGVGEGGCI